MLQLATGSQKFAFDLTTKIFQLECVRKGSILARQACSSSSNGREVLHDSMSDAFYDVKDRNIARQDKVSSQSRPRNVKQAMTSLSEPRYLQNSLSEGLYEYLPRRRAGPNVNSLSDPVPGWLQNSLSDAYYEIPQHVRMAAPTPRPRQGFNTATRGAGHTTQRIVVANRASVGDPEPLHNSLSHGDYTPRKR